MFNVLSHSEKLYLVQYAGNDLSDLLAFYNTIYDFPKENRIYDNHNYWVAEAVYAALQQSRTALKLTPYDYQQEAIGFALSRCSSLMLLPCGAGN